MTAKFRRPFNIMLWVCNCWGRHGGHRMVVEFTLPMHLKPITTNIVNSNPAQGRCTRCNIKFVSDLRQVCGFLRVLRFPPPVKLTTTI